MTAKRALLFGLLTWICGRTLLQKLLPFHDWASYARQDIAITALRLSCGAACLWIARRRWYDSALGIGTKSHWGTLAIFATGLAIIAQIIPAVVRPANWQEAFWIRAVEIAIALAVAYNEECGFRALFYSGMREIAGRWAAVWGSTLLFTAMHIGYQPYFHLLKVFFLGLFFAFLRDRGFSLKALIGIHFALDVIDPIFLPSGDVPFIYYEISVGLAAVAALLAWKVPVKHDSKGESLLFVYGSLKPGETAAKELKIVERCDIIGPASTIGRLGERGGYPALLPSKKRDEMVEGVLLRLRDYELLDTLDEYEGEDYLRDKAAIQTHDGTSCEAWIYVASDAN